MCQIKNLLTELLLAINILSALTLPQAETTRALNLHILEQVLRIHIPVLVLKATQDPAVQNSFSFSVRYYLAHNIYKAFSVLEQ